MKVAVIGAGVSGLASARALKAARFEVVVYEERDDIGGVWSASRRYPGVRTQNDKRTYAFSDLPMPDEFEEYPQGAAIQAYLSSYARRHDLGASIRLGTRVERASRGTDGRGWDLEVSTAQERRIEHFDWLIVASGICSKPNVQTFPGQEQFVADGGMVVPSTSLGDGEMLQGRHAVIVGYGKSAADIAVAAMSRSQSVTVVARGLAWKLPLRMGRVTFQRIALTRLGEHLLWAPVRSMAGRVVRRLDRPVRRHVVNWLERRVRRVLELDRRGLAPTGPITEFTHLATPGFFEAIDSGTITLKQPARLIRLEADSQGRFAVLSDGLRLRADVVVTATGFDLDLSFFSADARASLTDERGRLELYLHTLPEQLPDIAFIGWTNSFRSPIGAEMQALWITALLLGTAHRPDRRAWSTHRKTYWLTHAAAAAAGEPQFSHGASIADFDRWIKEAGARVPLRVRVHEWVHPLDPSSYGSLLRHVVERAAAQADSAANASTQPSRGR